MPILETWIDLERELARTAVWNWRMRVMSSMNRYDLSPRERQVAWLLFDGLSNKEIAASTGTAIQTVKTHLTHIYLKLNVRSRDQTILRLLGIDHGDSI